MTTRTTPYPHPVAGDIALLPAVVEAVRAAGTRLLAVPVRGGALDSVEQIAAAIGRSDAISLAVLRPLLERARPQAGWVDDELDGGELPAGEWWITDPVEGAINREHGLTEWAVTATLVRDNVPVVTAVHLPVDATTFTGVRGGGSHQDGRVLRVSGKTSLDAALVGTGQASPREVPATHRAMGRTVTAMLEAAGVVRVSVPATLQLVNVAAGRADVFWQHSAVRSGLAAGALLVAEAGGRISDLAGQSWTLESEDFLAAAPGLHQAAVDVLAPLR